MANDYVIKAVQLARIQNPMLQPSAKDWVRLESEIGLTLPPDYKELVSSLGEGGFGCGLHLHNPCSLSEYVRLSNECLVMHHQFVCDLEEKTGYPIYPSAGGMVLIADIDRQAFYFKPDATGKRLEELVWLDIDTEEARLLPYTFSRFICDLYNGLIHEDWAEELRQYFWRAGKESFFKNG
jgi:hypothetical protein